MTASALQTTKAAMVLLVCLAGPPALAGDHAPAEAALVDAAKFLDLTAADCGLQKAIDEAARAGLPAGGRGLPAGAD